MSWARIKKLTSTSHKRELTKEEYLEFESLMDARRREIREGIPRPFCCALARKYPVITFCVNYKSDSSASDGSWHIHISGELLSDFSDACPDYWGALERF